MAISPDDERDIFVALENLRGEIRALKDRSTCGVHQREIQEIRDRTRILEMAAGKEKFATAVIGAIAAGLVLLGQYVFNGGGPRGS